MKMKRLMSALCMVLLFSLVASPAAAAGRVVLRLAHPVPDGSVWDKALKKMGAEWQKSSKGQVRLVIYPGGVMGTDSAVVRKMRHRQLHAAALTANGLSKIDDAFNAFGIPLFFDSYDELFYVIEQLEPLLKQRLEAKGFVFLHWGHGGWAHFFSKKPVHRVEDLKKLKIFTSAGDEEMVQWWKNNGFQPVAMATTDIPTGLQSGMIDALALPPLVALSLQWFRQTPYMHDLGLGPLIAATVVTRKAWERVPEEHRSALLEAARRAEEQLKAEIPSQDRLAVEEMKKRGLEVTRSTDEAEWRHEAQRFARSMRGTMVPAEIFDRVFAARDAFRRQQARGEAP